MSAWLWIAFLGFVAGMIAVDLAVLHRKAHVVRAREALVWTGFTVALALAFSGFVYFAYEHNWLGVAEAAKESVGRPMPGHEAFAKFLTVWLLEYALSLDNLLVVASIFACFKVPAALQRRVLFWGVLGAVLLRAAAILLGAWLIASFAWMAYLFGAVLLFAAVKMLAVRETSEDWSRAPAARLVRRVFPITPDFDGEKLFTRLPTGALAATPLLLCLALVESTDLLFAVDSIPAAFAITRDPFLVFTANVFAVLGLRSLYFALSAIMGRLRYLRVSLVFVLLYLGVKMTISPHYAIPVYVSLVVVVGALAAGTTASMVVARRSTRPEPPFGRDVERIARYTVKQITLAVVFVVGVGLMLAAPVVGILPGPGGIILFVLGLAILSSRFPWARKLANRLKWTAIRVGRKVATKLGLRRLAFWRRGKASRHRGIQASRHQGERKHDRRPAGRASG